MKEFLILGETNEDTKLWLNENYPNLYNVSIKVISK